MKFSRVDFNRIARFNGNQSDPYGWSGNISIDKDADIYYVRWPESPAVLYSDGQDLSEIGEARFSADFIKICHDHYMRNQPY